jgi:hypothetical protein
MKLASECPARQRRKKAEGTNGCVSSRGCYGREGSRWELSTVTMAREHGAGWKGGMARGSGVGGQVCVPKEIASGIARYH